MGARASDRFSKPIALYSAYCKHSADFLRALDAVPGSAIALSVDPEPETGERSAAFVSLQRVLNEQYGVQVARVPTVVVPADDGVQLLSGASAFAWLDRLAPRRPQEARDVVGVNPNEMLAFSDSYAPLASKGLHDASSQSFQFLDVGAQAIPTYDETAVGGGKSKDKGCQDQYERLLKEREQL